MVGAGSAKTASSFTRSAHDSRATKPAPKEKTAFVFGAAHPDSEYLASAAVPYNDQQQMVRDYGREKAVEGPTKRW